MTEWRRYQNRHPRHRTAGSGLQRQIGGGGELTPFDRPAQRIGDLRTNNGSLGGCECDLMWVFTSVMVTMTRADELADIRPSDVEHVWAPQV